MSRALLPTELPHQKVFGAPDENRTRAIRSTAGCSTIELQGQIWHLRRESNPRLLCEKQGYWPLYYGDMILVPEAGLEPALLSETDFKSAASADSTTRA